MALERKQVEKALWDDILETETDYTIQEVVDKINSLLQMTREKNISSENVRLKICKEHEYESYTAVHFNAYEVRLENDEEYNSRVTHEKACAVSWEAQERQKLAQLLAKYGAPK